MKLVQDVIKHLDEENLINVQWQGCDNRKRDELMQERGFPKFFNEVLMEDIGRRFKKGILEYPIYVVDAYSGVFVAIKVIEIKPYYWKGIPSTNKYMVKYAYAWKLDMAQDPQRAEVAEVDMIFNTSDEGKYIDTPTGLLGQRRWILWGNVQQKFINWIDDPFNVK